MIYGGFQNQNQSNLESPEVQPLGIERLAMNQSNASAVRGYSVSVFRCQSPKNPILSLSASRSITFL